MSRVRPKQAPVVSSRLIDGTRAERVRVKAATRDGRPVVRIDLLEPLTSHCGSLTVVGRPLSIPIANVPALIDALAASLTEAGAEPAEESAPAADDF